MICDIKYSMETCAIQVDTLYLANTLFSVQGVRFAQRYFSINEKCFRPLTIGQNWHA